MLPPPLSPITRVALYLRVSTDLQLERNGVTGQRDALLEYACAHGLNIVAEYEDGGLSGTASERERPSLQRLLTDAEHGRFDLVLVFKLDRLARDIYLTHQLIGRLRGHGVHFKAVAEEFVDTRMPGSELGIAFMAAMASQEREATIRRFSAGTRAAVSRGQYSGGITPYGYRVLNGLLVIVEAEAEVVREIYHRSAVLGESTVTISLSLNSRGVPTKYVSEGRGVRRKATAGVWTAGAVRRILTNKTYTGVFEYGKRRKKGAEPRAITIGAAPALVSAELFDGAAQTLRRNLLIAARNARHVYLLRSLIRCEVCARTYVGSRSAKSNAYVCGGRNNRKGEPGARRCGNPRVNATELETHVWSAITAFIERPETLALAQTLPEDERPDEREQLEAQHRDLKGQAERLNKIYTLGRLSDEAYEAEYAALAGRVRALEAALAALQDDAQLAQQRQTVRARLDALRAELVGRLQTLDDRARQHLVHQLVRRIWVAPDRTVKVEYHF